MIVHKRGIEFTLEELQNVVASNDKKRFSLSEDGLLIRANQGHSIEVELGYAHSVFGFLMETNVMDKISRRNFTSQTLQSLLTLSLVETLSQERLLGKNIDRITGSWLTEVEEISRAMKSGRAKQTEWQQKIAEIFTRVELPDFLRSVDFERVSKKIKFPDDSEGVIPVNPSRPKGLPEELEFSTYIYGLKKGRAIAPHCHRNMTSMHMLIGGQIHAWHFDRLADEPKHLIIKPTLDRALAMGEASTTSDDKDNVHWFKATSDVAFTFNLAVFEIDRSSQFSGRQFYLDPAGGEKLGDGSLRVRHLTSQEARRLYGKS